MKIAGRLLWLAAAIFALTAPLFLERGSLNDLWNLAFAVILAAAWNLLGGFAGQVSLGYSAFIGIGAYTTVLLSLKDWNPFVTLPLGALLAAIFSVVIGLPAFRLRGPYFTIATIGVAEAIRVTASTVEFTGGSSGLRMPAVTFDFNANYFAMIGLAIVTVLIAAWVKRSAFGRALAAIKQDIDAAEAVGVSSTRFKLAAHALSAALVGIAGGLYAINFQYISPASVFDFRLSLSIVLMPIIGGVGTLAGPIFGALIISTLQIKLLSIPALRDSFLFVYGGLLIVVMLFEPGGFIGIMRRFRSAGVPAGRPGGVSPRGA
ncbi:MAG TPA: branched-chain amino acid ABC transporter permease, partial [Thermoanaerobaculia bacterium]|nr:branched-chain amino acid ABC transporter permease [Thermoanaerobaculia bacterium]